VNVGSICAPAEVSIASCDHLVERCTSSILPTLSHLWRAGAWNRGIGAWICTVGRSLQRDSIPVATCCGVLARSLFWQLPFGRSRAPQGFERQRTLSLIAGISCVWFASWATAGLVAAFQYSIAVDFPYALAIDNVRRAEAIDPVLAEKGRLLAFALALGTTNRTCPGTDPNDRLIGLDAHRGFDIPAITNSDTHGSTTTWPPDKGGIRSCENG
jgi:hypothetical protein